MLCRALHFAQPRWKLVRAGAILSGTGVCACKRVPAWLPRWAPSFHLCQAFELSHWCTEFCRGWGLWLHPCSESAGLSEREVVWHLENYYNCYYLLFTVCQVPNFPYTTPIKSSQQLHKVGTPVNLTLQIGNLSLENFRSDVGGQQLTVQIRSPMWDCGTPNVVLSRMLLLGLDGLRLDMETRASDPRARSNVAMGSVLLLLEGGEAVGWECQGLLSCGTEVSSPTLVPDWKCHRLVQAGVYTVQMCYVWGPFASKPVH